MTKTYRRAVTAIAVLIINSSANADPNDGVKIPARLDCGALLPKRANDSAFVAQMTFNYSKGELSADRQRLSGSGVERFTGSIDPLGRIEMTAKYDEKQSWIYRFKGRLDDKGPTVLKGDVEILSGATGRRTCTITFLPKPDELMAAFAR